MKPVLILASQSPRRKELLSQLGYQFETISADIDESIIDNELPRDYVLRLAIEKASVVAQNQATDSVVLGSDTSVIFEQHILGKPESLEDCCKQLPMLSNNTHQVLTAIAVIKNNNIYSEIISTDVTFKALSIEEIHRYWHTGEPQDKAGSYGIQGWSIDASFAVSSGAVSFQGC